MKVKDIILEAANPAQQAAIAISMKKAGKKPKDDMDETKQRLDPKCWTGYHKAGTKMKGDTRVNNCVPNESVSEGTTNADWTKDSAAVKASKDPKFVNSMIDKWGHRGSAWLNHPALLPKNEDLTPDEQFDIIEEMVEELALHYGVDSEEIWEHFETVDDNDLFEAAAWQKSSGKNKNGGLNQKGVNSYRREHPGSKLQTAVTTKPSKLKKGSKAAKRRKSFCARMRGMKKHRTGAKTAHDPNSRINKSLRKWNC